MKGAALTVGARDLVGLAQQVEDATAKDAVDWAGAAASTIRLRDALGARDLLAKPAR